MAYWQVRAKLDNKSYIDTFLKENRWALLDKKHIKSKVFEKQINSVRENELLFLVDDNQKIDYYARCIENPLNGVDILVDKWKKMTYTVDALNGGYFIRTMFSIKKRDKINELLDAVNLNLYKLKKIKIQNFRLFKNFEMNLNKDINVIIADNGAGKTTILDAIAIGYGAMLTRFPNIQGFSFKKQDLHINENNKQEGYTKIELQSMKNCFWDRVERRDRTVKYNPYGVKELNYVVDSIVIKENLDKEYQMPLVIYYPSDRGIFNPTTEKNSLSKKSFSRFSSLDGALSSSSKFNHFFDWFYYMQTLEANEKIEKENLKFRLPELEALKEALENMLPWCKNPKIQIRRGQKTIEFTIEKEESDGTIKDFKIEQLSAGYRMVLAMVMDISARMSEANPHLGNKSEAIILIDELDLHLHPKWQQTILSDLKRTFPNAQFIVTTHSVHILSSIQKEKLFILKNGKIEKTYLRTYGKSIDGLLLSSFQIESLRYPKVAKKINELQELIYSNEYNEELFFSKLEELEKDVGKDDIDVLKLRLEKLKRDKNA